MYQEQVLHEKQTAKKRHKNISLEHFVIHKFDRKLRVKKDTTSWWSIDQFNNCHLSLKEILYLNSGVCTDCKSLPSCVLRIQEVNEVTAPVQRRALWSAENEALLQRKALWSAESEAQIHTEISNFLTFILYLHYELLLCSLCSLRNINQKGFC